MGIKERVEMDPSLSYIVFGGTSLIMTLLQHNPQVFMPQREPQFFDNIKNKTKSEMMSFDMFIMYKSLVSV